MPSFTKRFSLSKAPSVTPAYPNDKKEKSPPVYPDEKKEKDSANTATVERQAASSPPPSYVPAENEPTTEDLTAGFSNLQISKQTATPTVDVCIAHLKLLEAFHLVKEDVTNTDGVFGLWDLPEGASESDLTPANIREKRWALYVARAADRFESWFLTMLPQIDTNSKRLTQADMLNYALKDWTIKGSPIDWQPTHLPPLDVLMVWHSFMLNPRSYLEDCIRFGLSNVWATGLPWAAINNAIDIDFNYSTSQEAVSMFEAHTGKSWDNLKDSMTKTIRCPKCTIEVEVPWTTCGRPETQRQLPLDLVGSGYAESQFSYICHSCALDINHDVLRVAKFKKDTELLLLNNYPMPGTLMAGTTGLPHIIHDDKEAASFTGTFPNRLLLLELRTKILEIFNNFEKPTIETIRDYIEVAAGSTSVILKVNGQKNILKSRPLNKQERLAIRKMMSRYWDNHSTFALDLSGAVIRQGTFIDKMHGIDWLHSPALKTTVPRLLLKYMRFISIMATHPAQVAVPTLDVDLAWHSHQLSPQQYFNYSYKTTKKFIDHDDKIDEDRLSIAFEWTSNIYEKAYGEVYSECTCWYCEAIRAKYTSKLSSMLGTSRHEDAQDAFYDSGAAKLCPPSNSAHISAHNAVRAEADSTTRKRVLVTYRAARRRELDIGYEKACKRAEKKGRPVPNRNAYYENAWGYQYAMMPYMAPVYMTPGIYVSDPCYLPVGAGMTGNCAAGTCGGGVAAGGCANGSCGAGGCGGGAGAGGCGGGGGGGGCGGGGGGGGGGCGGGGC